jgi:hypothetical protein
VVVLLQLLTVVIVLHLLRGMRAMIEAGQVAAAIPLVAAQLSIGLPNAAAMVPAPDDPNIAAALAAVSGKPAAPQSLSDPLAALRAQG